MKLHESLIEIGSKLGHAKKTVTRNIIQKLKEDKGIGMAGLVLMAIFLVAIYALSPSIKTFVNTLWTTVSTFFTTIFTNAFKTT